MVGFVETLVEVDECDGRATLNVSISLPEPDPLLPFGIGIVFTLLVNTVDGSAGMGDAHQFSQQFSIIYTFPIQDQDQLQLPAMILGLGLRTISRL